jgi:hypothetical protein
LQRQLKSLGMKGEKGLDDAQGDMKEAEGDLKGEQGKSGQSGQGGKGAAVDAQGRALEALREGAQGLQKQMNGQGQVRAREARAPMSAAGAGRGKCPATIRSAAERKARTDARMGR